MRVRHAFAFALAFALAATGPARADDGDDGDASGYGDAAGEDDGGDDADDADADADADADEAGTIPWRDALPAPPIAVTGGRGVALTSLRSVRSVLDDTDLAARPPRTLPEALSSAGLVVPGAGGPFAAPLLRGLGGPRVAVLLDGIRLDDSTARTGFSAPLAAVDHASTGRVEVLHGLGGARLGPGTFGGTVHVLGRTASPDRTTAYTLPRVLAWHSTADGGLQTRLEGRHENFGAGLYGGLTLRRLGDLRAGGDAPGPTPTRASGLAFDTRLVVGVLNGQRMELGARLVRDYGAALPVAGAVLAERFRSLWYARWRWLVGLGPLAEVEIVTWLHDKRDVRDARDAPESVAPSAGPSAPPRRRDRTDVTSPGLAARAVLTLGERADLTFGLDLWHDALRARAYDYAARPSLDASPLLRAPRTATVERAPHLPARGAFTTLGLFALPSWRPARWLTLEGGARVTGVRAASRAGDLAVAAGAGGPGDVRFTRAAVTLEAGAAVHPHDAVSFALTFAEGWRPPSWHELAGSGAAPGAATYDLPAVDPRPERAWSVEAGPRVATGAVALAASGWVTRMAHPLWWAPSSCPPAGLPGCSAGAGASDAGLPVARASSAHHAFLAGFEIDASVLLAPGLAATARAAWTYAEVETGDATHLAVPAAHVPALSADVGLRWTSRDGRAFAAATVKAGHVPDRVAGVTVARGGFCLDGPGACAAGGSFAVLSAYAGWEFVRGVRASLALDGIGDAAWRWPGAPFPAPGPSAILALDVSHAL